MLPNKAAALQMARVVARSGAADLHRSLLDTTKKARWMARLCAAIDEAFKGKRPSIRRLQTFIQNHPDFHPVTIFADLPKPAKMSPAPGRPRTWKVPPIATLGALAKRLNLLPNELQWFSDCKSLERHAAGKLCHYKRRWHRKRDGSFRLIESPKQRLKAIQRAILREILAAIPSHEACHGFKPTRSVLTFARPHASKTLVLKIDLKDFFPAFSFSRIHHLFLTVGYPENVALTLAGLCTTICPRSPFAELPSEHRRPMRQLYARKHLAQGAPTSPMLANLCAFNLDCRLAGLAQAAGADYTRYADDLLFSGDETFARNINRFLVHSMAIALEEGFTVNARKTRVMRRAVAQRAAGLILNVTPNISRKEYDTLKAILTNCAKFGPTSQNRTTHPNFQSDLQGRIAHITMINPNRGAKLRKIFNEIHWP